MDILICIAAIFGLAFFVKENDGPWGVMNWIRNKLVANKYVGVFFYKLLSCYFCLGFHCGWIVYLLHEKSYSWQNFLLWGFGGATLCIVIDAVLNKLYQHE